MPVKDRNPFGGPEESESKADIGVTDPFDVPDMVVVCPRCTERIPEKIKTHTTPYEIQRTCTTCGCKWACGSVGGAVMVPITPEMKMRTLAELEAEDADLYSEDTRLSGTELWFDD